MSSFSHSGGPAFDVIFLIAGLLALLALRANLGLFKALRALVPLREDDDSLRNVKNGAINERCSLFYNTVKRSK